MNIVENIKDIVRVELGLLLPDLLKQVGEDFLCKLHKPEFESYGRYLTPEQTCKYIGKKSKTGLELLLKSKGIIPTKFNERVVRYDRYDLDRLNVKSSIEKYTEKIKAN